MIISEKYLMIFPFFFPLTVCLLPILTSIVIFPAHGEAAKNVQLWTTVGRFLIVSIY